MMKRIVTIGFAMLCIARVAGAAPLVLPGGTPIFFQFNNLEQVNSANTLVVPGGYDGTVTQGNWGVFNVSSVQTGAVSSPHNDISGGPLIFGDDGPGGSAGQITGIFYGIHILPGGTTANSGFIDLYWHDPGSDPVTAACLAGTTCLPNAATVSEFTSGTFLARLDFASGINPGDSNVNIQSNIDPSTQGGSGHADSFANVDLTDLGAWSNVLNGDWFNTAFGTRDVRFSNFFNVDVTSWNGPNGTVGVRSNDPGRVFTAVPEPATLTLLGLGLTGLAARRRRRSQA